MPHGPKTCVLSSGAQPVLEDGFDFSGQQQLTYVRLQMLIPMELALPDGCKLDLWVGDEGHDLCLHGGRFSRGGHFESDLYCSRMRGLATDDLGRPTKIPHILEAPAGAAKEVWFMASSAFCAKPTRRWDGSPILGCAGLAQLTSFCIAADDIAALTVPATNGRKPISVLCKCVRLC